MTGAPRRKSGLVLAFGNTLRGDDGVGWKIAEALEESIAARTATDADDAKARDVEVLVTHQLTPELTHPISGAHTVIFVDCSAVAAPGTVSTLELHTGTQLPRVFTHHVDPASLLALTQELYGEIPAHAYAVTVGGLSFELSEKLTEPVRRAIPKAVAEVNRLLQENTSGLANESRL